MIKQQVLISPSSFGECGPEPLRLLEEAGLEFKLNPFRRKLERDEVVTLAKGCRGLIAGVESLDREVLERLSDLRCISRCGAGVDSVDLVCARELGIPVLNTPDGPTRAVAELALGFALALARGIPRRDHAMRANVWDKSLGTLIEGKTVGVVGLGRIGRAVALLFQAIGCRVVGNDTRPDIEWARAHDVPLLPLRELLASADIVSLHVAATSGMAPLLGRQELALMKSTSLLLNLSRGEVVDEDALTEALSTGIVAGAALDVFSKEPYQGPLLRLENVILSPHVGSYAREARLRMEVDAVRNLIAGLGS